MRRLALGLTLALTGALSSLGGATLTTHAAGNTGNPVNWQQRDTAVYVVSTLNLLTNRRGRLVIQRLHPTQFDVFSDTGKQDLYFIQVRRASASVAVFAYQMGWARPQLISMAAPHSGVRAASDAMAQSFRTDPKQLIGSFTSTTPN